MEEASVQATTSTTALTTSTASKPIQGKWFHLVINNYEEPLESVAEMMRQISQTSSLWPLISKPVKWVIARETHKNNNKHIHIVLCIENKTSIVRRDIFDNLFGCPVHVEGFANTHHRKYVLKKYITKENEYLVHNIDLTKISIKEDQDLKNENKGTDSDEELRTQPMTYLRKYFKEGVKKPADFENERPNFYVKNRRMVEDCYDSVVRIKHYNSKPVSFKFMGIEHFREPSLKTKKIGIYVWGPKNMYKSSFFTVYLSKLCDTPWNVIQRHKKASKWIGRVSEADIYMIDAVRPGINSEDRKSVV